MTKQSEPDRPPQGGDADRRESADPARSAEELLPEVYTELRRLAAAQMAREGAGRTLDATALVHEAYLRLSGGGGSSPAEAACWNGRGHFFGAAGRAMRRILVEGARRRAAQRHGGGRRRVALEDEDLQAPRPEHDVLAVEEALERLETQDPRKGRVLELRYFAGLNAGETAEALGVSLATLERDWKFIKAWLRAELDPGES